VVLTGANGAGKTNLLEALSLLSPGRGLRRARLDEVGYGASGTPVAVPVPATAPAADGLGRASGWAVAATVLGAAGPVEIGTGADPTPGKERRLVRIDGHPARSQTALAEHLTLLWLTPAMDRLFIEGSSARRRFLDRLVFGFDPGHAGRLTRYEHALRERARLLEEGGADPAWLAALEQQMAETGVAVALARRAVVERLDRACAAGIGPFPRAVPVIGGSVEDSLAEQSPAEVEAMMRAQLRESRRRDAASGGASLGPHRSDFVVGYRKGDDDRAEPVPAPACSTGEQKALLLSIVLANARLLADGPAGPPLLLLDEVAAHLDPSRRAALYAEILALGSQAWLTGTDPILFAPLHGHAHFLSVTPGQITETSHGDGGLRFK
jgi:DNA replication and repair protein RecF